MDRNELDLMKPHSLFTNSPFLGLIACLTFTGNARSQSTEPAHNEKAPPAPENAQVFDFEKDDPGKVPPGFTAGLTGGGGAERWETKESKGASSGGRVVAQLRDDRTNARCACGHRRAIQRCA